MLTGVIAVNTFPLHLLKMQRKEIEQDLLPALKSFCEAADHPLKKAITQRALKLLEKGECGTPFYYLIRYNSIFKTYERLLAQKGPGPIDDFLDVIEPQLSKLQTK